MRLLKGGLHPFSPVAGDSVESVAYTVMRKKDVLSAHYELYGRLQNLILPEATVGESGRRRDELWRNSCFELFLKDRGAGAGPYLECNFSPSGDWNVYELQGYRLGLRETSQVRRPTVHTRRAENYFSLYVELDCRLFMSHTSGVDIGVCCVIEDAKGEFSYWALSHHGKKPDFHDVRSFELCL